MPTPEAKRPTLGYSNPVSKISRGGSLPVELSSFNGFESMTSQLVKLCTTMALQGGEEAHIEGLEEVAAVEGQAKDNYIVLHSIEEELNGNMRTMAIQNKETCSPICTITVSFLSSIWQGSYTAAVCGSKT